MSRYIEAIAGAIRAREGHTHPWEARAAERALAALLRTLREDTQIVALLIDAFGGDENGTAPMQDRAAYALSRLCQHLESDG